MAHGAILGQTVDNEPVSSAVQLSSAAQSALGLSAGATLDDALLQMVNGDVLLDTTIQTTGTQINVSVDGSAWGDYSYVMVDINYTLQSGGSLVNVRINGSSSKSQTYTALYEDDYSDWVPGSAMVGYMFKRYTSSGFSRIIFPVLKNTTNDVSCFIISPNSFTIGAYYSQRYVDVTALNIVPSNGGFKSGTTIKVWGKR